MKPLSWATLHSRDMRQRVNRSVMSQVAISDIKKNNGEMFQLDGQERTVREHGV